MTLIYIWIFKCGATCQILACDDYFLTSAANDLNGLSFENRGGMEKRREGR